MNLTELSNVNRLLCSISGHKYKLVKKVTKHLKHYKCSCCGSEVTTKTVIIKRNTRKGTKKKAVA